MSNENATACASSTPYTAKIVTNVASRTPKPLMLIGKN
jgi:hypothetical protein